MEVYQILIALLNNNEIIITDCRNNCFIIYDKDLNFIRKVDKINREIFSSSTILANFDEKKFYICEYINDRILITDLDLNFIKSVGSGGSRNCEFDLPHDICFSNSKFYICDYLNKRIQVCSDFLTSFKLKYFAWRVRSTNSTICVVPDSTHGIYFYDAYDFHLIRNYNHTLGGISQINSMFNKFN
jgi:hypothetical protein